MGSSSFDWQADLSDADKRTLQLALAYEKQRSITQNFYRIFDVATDPRPLPVFKALKTVEKWLDDSNVRISNSRVTWQGYLEYLFKSLAPTIPQPGQIKNNRALQEYLKSAPNTHVDSMADVDLEALYKKIIDPHFANDSALLEMMGLRNIRLKKRKADE